MGMAVQLGLALFTLGIRPSSQAPFLGTSSPNAFLLLATHGLRCGTIPIPFSSLVSVYIFHPSSQEHPIIRWGAEITSRVLVPPYTMVNLMQTLPLVSLESPPSPG